MGRFPAASCACTVDTPPCTCFLRVGAGGEDRLRPAVSFRGCKHHHSAAPVADLDKHLAWTLLVLTSMVIQKALATL